MGFLGVRDRSLMFFVRGSFFIVLELFGFLEYMFIVMDGKIEVLSD